METKILGIIIILGSIFLFLKGSYFEQYSENEKTKKDGVAITIVAFIFVGLGMILING